MHSTVIANKIDVFLGSDLSVKAEYISSWRSKGIYPRSVFPKLVEILNYYFQVGEGQGFPSAIEAYPRFPLLISQLMAAINAAYPDDVLFFCAQSMLVNGSKIYLAAILNKILVCDLDDMKEQMISLARLLSRYDPSYIVESRFLNPIYLKDFVGPGFTFSHFKTKCLPILLSSVLTESQSTNLPQMIQKLDSFTKRFQNATVFSTEIIEEIRRIYEFRWNTIKGTALDYTRKQPEKKDDAQGFWVAVAQMLSGAKLIPSGYYSFLMPSIQYDKVYLAGQPTDEPLELYPLSYFILSEHGDRLLSLDNSVKYFDEGSVGAAFCNRDVWPPRDFTPLEQARTQFAADRFSGRPELLKHNLQLPVRRRTVNIVYELLLSSLRKPIIDADLEFAYLTFAEKIGELDADERNRFYCQRILWNGDDYSVHDVLSEIALGDVKEGCTSKWGAYLLKFVIDHRPEAYISAKIDRLVHVQWMREQSAKKEFRETDADILKRNEMLMVSLLTYPFSYRLISGSTLSLLDCSNNCDSVLAPFFFQFKTKIENNVKFNGYAELMSQMVLPCLLQDEQSNLPEDVQAWLRSIRDENYLSKTNLCVDPKTLFCILRTFDLSANDQNSVKILLDDLIQTFLQAQNESTLNIRVNVKLQNFLAARPVAQRKILLEALGSNHEPIHNQDFINSVYSFVVSRQEIVSSSFSRNLSFFPSSTSPKASVRQICLPDLSGLNSVKEVVSFVSGERVAVGLVNHNETELVRRLG